MSARIIIQENGPFSCSVSADVRDVDHARWLLLQGLLAWENAEYSVPSDKLHLIRSFLANIGAADQAAARRFLILALLQLEDESNEQRFVVPRSLLPVVLTR